MPVIDSSSSVLSTDQALFDDIDSFVADGQLILSNLLLFDDIGEFIANGVVSYVGTALFDDLDDFTADGFKNNEANVFGTAIFEDLDDFTAAAITRYTGLAVFEDVDDFTAEDFLSVAETPTQTFIVDIIDNAAALLASRRLIWIPRLRVDGVDVRILKATLNDTESEAGKTLNVILANPADKALFTHTALVDFGYGTRSGGNWVDGTMEWEITGGKADTSASSVSGPPQQMSDSVSVTIIDAIKTNLLKTATRPLIVFDSNRTSVDTSQIDILRDTAGHTYPSEIKTIAGMKLYDLLTETLVHRCGFTEFKTNLPNYPVLRYDCQMGESLYNALKKYIGMFEPAVLAVGTTLWIIDTTLALPSGFPAPREIVFDEVMSNSNNEELRKIDGFLVDYVETDNTYDYTTFRFENGTIPVGNTSVEFHRIFIEYRKLAQPDIVVKDALNIEEKSIYSNGLLIGQSSENWIYQSNGNIASRRKTVDTYIPDMTTPSSNRILQREREETEEYTYAPNPFRPYEQYIQFRKLSVYGLYSVDTENPQLNQPFKGSAVNLFRCGNLQSSMRYVNGNISTYTETAEPLRSGNVRVRVHEIDEVMDIVTKDYTEERPGAVGMRSTGMNQKQILVFAADNFTRTTDRIDSVHAGELPLTLALPLFRRVLIKRNTKNNKFENRLVGYDKSVKKGTLMRAKSMRSDTVAVPSLVVSRTIESDRNGTFMSVSSRAV